MHGVFYHLRHGQSKNEARGPCSRFFGASWSICSVEGTSKFLVKGCVTGTVRVFTTCCHVFVVQMSVSV